MKASTKCFIGAGIGFGIAAITAMIGMSLWLSTSIFMIGTFFLLLGIGFTNL
jgi:hypothetical protein